jgi:hypothetical protein
MRCVVCSFRLTCHVISSLVAPLFVMCTPIQQHNALTPSNNNVIHQTVEGESILIEEGFTLQKYEQLFFDTMEQDELEEWTDRLPHHPKLPPKTEKNCVSNSPASSLDDSDVDEEGYFVLGGGQKKGGASSTKTRTNKKKSTTQTNKKRKNRSKNNDNEEEDYESDGEDGMPGGKLRRIQKELFDTWLSGKDELIWSSASTKKKKKSLKAIKAEVAATKDAIIENKPESEKYVQFKKQRVDPLVEKVELAVEEYAEEQKDALKKELMELFILDDYPRKKEGGDEEDGGGEGEKENVEGKGVGGGKDDAVMKIVEEEKVDSKGAEDKSEENSSDNDKVVEDGKDSNADWTSEVIEGSNGNGNN